MSLDLAKVLGLEFDDVEETAWWRMLGAHILMDSGNLICAQSVLEFSFHKS